MDLRKIAVSKKEFVYKIYRVRYILYAMFFIFVVYTLFYYSEKKKESLYNELAEYQKINFLIKNGKPKTKTLNENYIRSMFPNNTINYIKYQNGIYQVKASNLNIKDLANIVYNIENDGFKILFLKSIDYTGKQDFTIHMEISS